MKHAKQQYLERLRRVPKVWREALSKLRFSGSWSGPTWMLVSTVHLDVLPLLPGFVLEDTRGKAGVGKLGRLCYDRRSIDVYVDPYYPKKDILVGWREWTPTPGNGVAIAWGT